MRAIAITIAATFLAFAPGARAADNLGLADEKVESFKAKVVDIQCELTGQCAPSCGSGRRPLGLLTVDGKLRVAAKGSVNFAGVTPDLLPYCGREIYVDGLLIDSPKAVLYFVQFIREKEADPWKPTEAFATEWQSKHGDPENWQRDDPQVKAIIAEKGVLGLGAGIKP